MFREKSDQILDFAISLLLECRSLLGSSPPAKHRHRAAVNTKMQIFRLRDRGQTSKINLRRDHHGNQMSVMVSLFVRSSRQKQEHVSMDAVTLILFVVGLGLLIVGAEALVRGASKLAAAAGISPLVIGLTIVAFGTSSPEMAVSVSSALQGQADVAVGNVVGSNIFNVLFILGIAALIAPLVVSKQLIRFDVPLMIGVSIIAMLFGWDGGISRIEGALLFMGIITYTVFLIQQSRKENKAKAAAAKADEFDKEYSDKPKNNLDYLKNIAFIIVGLGLLVQGSRWLVDGAIAMARTLGVDDVVIGLTIVAAGTSLPEVAASIIASIKGERDIAVGNVVGSNIFNILAVMGLSSIVAPNGLPVAPSIENFDMPIMIAVALACVPIFFTGWTIARWEGFVFLGYYVAYTAYLIFNVTQHAALPAFSNVMIYFVAPITLLTLVITTVRALQQQGVLKLSNQAVGIKK
jgi:cation:H+ antiporter